jgi:hypothetical protein
MLALSVLLTLVGCSPPDRADPASAPPEPASPPAAPETPAPPPAPVPPHRCAEVTPTPAGHRLVRGRATVLGAAAAPDAGTADALEAFDACLPHLAACWDVATVPFAVHELRLEVSAEGGIVAASVQRGAMDDAVLTRCVRETFARVGPALVAEPDGAGVVLARVVGESTAAR